MKKVTITRITKYADSQGTPGVLNLDGFVFATLELPWRNNEIGKSCLPVGTYPMSIGHPSKPIGGSDTLYLLKNTAPRTGIFIHSGNFAADRDSEHKSNSYGCPLIGYKLSDIRGQKAVMESKKALEHFMKLMNFEDGELTIKEI